MSVSRSRQIAWSVPVRELCNTARAGRSSHAVADALESYAKQMKAWPGLPDVVLFSFPDKKWCPSCKRWWHVRVLGINGVEEVVTWNQKTEADDGLQPYCRACQLDEVHTEEYKYGGFVRAMADRCPGAIAEWTREQYVNFVNKSYHKCEYCGWDVRHWGNGYWVDRGDNKRDYSPDNAVLCCWPCNHQKGTQTMDSWMRTVSDIKKSYPTSLIPWGDRNPQAYIYRKIGPEDLTIFLLDTQPPPPKPARNELSLFDG